MVLSPPRGLRDRTRTDGDGRGPGAGHAGGYRMRVASRGYLGIAVCLAIVCLGSGLLAVDVRAEESLADFKARVKAALAAAESALASEEARLDGLAESHSRRGLADGRPSVAQAAANVRLWERRIRELEAGEQTLRGELDGVLGSLGADITALAQRTRCRNRGRRRSGSARSVKPRYGRLGSRPSVSARSGKARRARRQPILFFVIVRIVPI